MALTAWAARIVLIVLIAALTPRALEVPVSWPAKTQAPA